MDHELSRFGRFSVTHPGLVRSVLAEQFSLDALAAAATKHGFPMGDADVKAELNRHFASSDIALSYLDREGVMRELTLEETFAPAGGAVAAATASFAAVGSSAAAMVYVSARAIAYSSAYAGAYSTSGAFSSASTFVWG